MHEICVFNRKACYLYKVDSLREQNYVIYYFSHATTMLVHILTMELCVVIGCSKHSDRDKDVSFHRIPAVLLNVILSYLRREGEVLLLLLPEHILILMHSITGSARGTLLQVSLLKVFTIILIHTGYLHWILDIQNWRKTKPVQFLGTKEP